MVNSLEKVALALGALVLLLFTQATPKRIERELGKVLRQSLPAKAIDVELDGVAGLPTLRGKFRKLLIHIDGLKFSGGQLAEMLPIRFTDRPEKEGRVGEVCLSLHDADYDGLQISEFSAHAKKVRFDLKASVREGRLVLVSAASGVITGQIAPEALQRHFAQVASKEGVEELSLSLQNGVAEIGGRWRLSVLQLGTVRVPFNAIVELFPANDCEVHLRIIRANVADIVPLPVGWLQERFKGLNPIMRFDLTPMQIRLHTVMVTPTSVSFSADFSLSPKPQ